MKTKLVRIGNSRGVRIPEQLLRTYGLREGSELDIEERREGLLLRVGARRTELLTWAEAYREMAAESAEPAEWADWDVTAGDGDAD
jgi:antitoxin component of MazEF toxin-antitoxin module